MKKILVIYGTRPELIKLAPLIIELKKSQYFLPVTCSTDQHVELLRPINDLFGIENQFSLKTMRKDQDLFHITSHVLNSLKNVLLDVKPDLVVVQGDTSSAFASALAATFLKVPVAHVEAGLRTFDKQSPFPEEINRCLISQIADYHFAPTDLSKQQLLDEGHDEQTVFQVGNTGIDALLQVESLITQARENEFNLPENKKWILFTAHRRENFGSPLMNIFDAIETFLSRHPDFHIIFPVHPNPAVKNLAFERFRSHPNISLLKPLDFSSLVWILKRIHFVLTDSGGLQEEAPSFGKPVLVLRNTTERPEGVLAGCSKLVGNSTEAILSSMEELSEPRSLTYQRMASVANPYGDGTASMQITAILEQVMMGNREREAA